MAVITYMGRKKNTAMFENMQKKLAMPKLKVLRFLSAVAGMMASPCFLRMTRTSAIKAASATTNRALLAMLPNGTKLVPSESPEMSAERKTTTAMVPATSNLPAALAMSAASSLGEVLAFTAS